MKVLLYILIGLLFVLPAGAWIVDRVVATVGERVITLGEVMTEARITKIMSSEDDSVLLPVEVSYSKEILDQMINRELVYLEAKQLRADSEKVEVLDNMLKFEEKFRNRAHLYVFLQNEGLTSDDLAERFIKEKVSAAYVTKKLSFMTTVSGKEVEAFYEESGLYNDKAINEVEGEIRRILSKDKVEISLSEWLSGLKKRNRVRYVKLPQH